MMLVTNRALVIAVWVLMAAVAVGSPAGVAQQALPSPEAAASSASPESAEQLAADASSAPAPVSSGDAVQVSGEAAQLAAPSPPLQSRTNLPHDLSPWGMFMQADIVVKAVMIGLVFASLLTWTVWLAKAIELGRANRRLRRGISQILSAATLDDAAASFENVNDTSAILVREAADELRVSAQTLDHTDGNGVNERVTSRLSRVETAAGQRMTKGTGVLATIGATAPFVGLFGTVWGIMNAFIGISQSQTTNLAVVAPGIAEALLATALGLVAAIPAVIIYNAFARSITGYRRLLGDASAGIERLSRELDFRRVPAPLSQAAE